MIAEQIRRRAELAKQIESGTQVTVYTRMGKQVCDGTASYPTDAGLCIGEQFYSDRLYLFVPPIMESEDNIQGEVISEGLVLDVDRRVAKLAAGVLEAQVGDAEAAKAGKPHPDNLPDDIRKAVITSSDMTDEQMQLVMGGVGEAALRALKSVNVREDELYSKVHEIQQAVKRILVEAGEKERKDDIDRKKSQGGDDD